ncbi:MAG: hypothetical protein ACC644_01560 [Candidatus Hydrothermarchaeales archaeon]
MLRCLGRRLVDACANCADFGIESIAKGRMTMKCDGGNISSCVQQFSDAYILGGYG